MNIVIVEDEKYTADLIIRLCRQYDPEIGIINVLSNVEESVKWFSQINSSIDLILMDIQLSDGSSFEIFELVKIEIPIIFITAYNEFALQAFKVNSIDYLLKPFDYSDLEKAFEKFFNLKKKLAPVTSPHYKQLFVEGLRPYKNRFLVRIGEQYKFLKTSSVAYFNYYDGLVTATLFDGKQQVIDESLDELEKVLDPGRYFRINRKIVISVDAVGSIQNYFNRRLSIHLLPDDRKEIISRERVSDFKGWMNF